MVECYGKQLSANQNETWGLPSTCPTWSHLGKRRIIFNSAFLSDMFVPWRVYIYIYIYSLSSKQIRNEPFWTNFQKYFTNMEVMEVGKDCIRRCLLPTLPEITVYIFNIAPENMAVFQMFFLFGAQPLFREQKAVNVLPRFKAERFVATTKASALGALLAGARCLFRETQTAI